MSDYLNRYLGKDINLVIASNLLLGDIANYLNKNNKEWNYEEVITAVYSESTKTCTKTTTIRTCAKPRRANNPKKRYCKKWNDPVETVQTIQM